MAKDQSMQKPRRRSAIDRLLDRVVPGLGGCWIFTGALDKDGYGQVGSGVRSSRRVHRVAYEHFNGPIPQGLEIDHLCHSRDASCPGGRDCLHRRCCNPAHLEAVTRRANTLRSRSFSAINARKTHCNTGHEFTAQNTYIRRDGTRLCRKCNDLAKAKWRAAKKAKRAAARSGIASH